MNVGKTVALYARVSTGQQDVEMQLAELRAACERHEWPIVGEVRSCATWSVDRLGRSLQHIVGFLGELE